MIDKFVNLHVHSTYSFTDGYGLPEQYIERAVELGQPALAVTDHGNISSHYKWYKQCGKAGIKPILGCEMYIVEDKSGLSEKHYNHITVLAKNNVGYKNLTKLVTKAWCEQFYYKPRITYQDIFDHQEGLIVLSGCLSSPFLQALKNGNDAKAVQDMFLFKNNIEEFYIELMPVSFKEAEEPYRKLMDLLKKDFKDFPTVVTADCHYVKKDQAKTQEVLLCVQSKDTMSNPDHWKFDQEDFYLMTRTDMELEMKLCFPEFDCTESLDNTVKIADMIDFTFPTATPIKYPMDEDKKFQRLVDLCTTALLEIGKSDNQVYMDRVKYELDLVKQKNFIDYFLVIWDLVNWAKDNGILVGPARGSAAGSLCCYLLRITEVDPIPYDLLFERFIDINREDLPDIDLDFEDNRRHEVKEYLAKKYGANKVGNLPTFAEFKGKSSIDDIGRVFEIPFKVCSEVKSAIIERSGGDSRASFTLEDTFTNPNFEKPKEHMEKYPEFKYSIALEGQLRQMGQHAAGIVISNEPLTDFCAIYKIKGEQVISLSYKDASDIGLLKIDLLGLGTLSVVSRCLRMIKERHNKDIDIYNLPLDDKKTYDGFIAEKLFGIFQFDGQALNQVSRQINPSDFESLSAITALARPGPLNGGSTTAFIKRRAGLEKVTYVHPIMKEYTKDSYGVVVYQEQVMKVMREVGKMSWKDTSEIRRLMSRSLGKEYFDSFKERFIIGARENGLSDKQIDDIWNSVCTFGSWAFNKSHSISYTFISYWTMWLKVHYPMEFYSSILFLTDKDDKRKKILKEYKKEGYKVLPVDINRSKEHFTIDGDGLRIGIGDIKGIGEMTAKKFVNNQPYQSYNDFARKNYNKIEPNRFTQLLLNLGAFRDIEEASTVTNLFGESVTEYTKHEFTFAERFTICPWDMEFGINARWSNFVSEHPDIFKSRIIPIEELKHLSEGFDGEDVVVWGIVYDKNLRDAREVSSSKGKSVDLSKYNGQFNFLNFVLEDDSDFVTVRLSHKLFPLYGNLVLEHVKPDDVVIIKGKMGSGIRMFFANKVAIMRHLKERTLKQDSPYQ